MITALRFSTEILTLKFRSMCVYQTQFIDLQLGTFYHIRGNRVLSAWCKAVIDNSCEGFEWGKKEVATLL
jgi:hypothetical protein